MNVSVVIPTYNRRHIIGSAIESAFSQGVDDLEVIVVDDGSTDGTVAWLAANYAGRPLRVLPNTRAKGPAGARNMGILAARGEIIAFLDSDDSFLPNHLAECATTLAAFPEVGVVFGRARYEHNGQPEDYMGPNFERKLALAPTLHATDMLSIFTSDFFTHLLQYGCWFNLSTVALRAVVARELMNEQLRISEDYEYWVRLSRNHQFACLRRPQIRYTLHDENISFEAAGSTADHAPRLLEALRIMSAYPGLSAAQRGLIQRQMADVLFDWAYRCRQHGKLLEASGLHFRSLRYGKGIANLMALVKLMLLALYPRKATERY